LHIAQAVIAKEDLQQEQKDVVKIYGRPANFSRMTGNRFVCMLPSHITAAACAISSLI